MDTSQIKLYAINTLKILGTTIFSIIFVFLVRGPMEVLFPATNHPWVLLIASIIFVSLGVALAWVINRYMYRGGLTSLFARRFSLGNFVFWLVIGFVLPITLMGIFYALGYVQWSTIAGTTPLMGMTYALATAILPGILEELSSRYILYGYIRTITGKTWAFIISGLVFGALHLPGVDSLAGALGLMAAALAVSLLFVVLYEMTGSIWAPMIIHVIWDIFTIKNGFVITNMFEKIEGPLYHSFLKIDITTPNLLVSGGEFGIESSIIAIVMYLVVALLVWYALRNKKEAV